MNNIDLQKKYRDILKKYENTEQQYLECLSNLQNKPCSSDFLNKLSKQLEKQNDILLSMSKDILQSSQTLTNEKKKELERIHKKLVNDKKRIKILQASNNNMERDSSTYVLQQNYLYMFTSIFALLLVFYICKIMLFPGPISPIPIVLIALIILFIYFTS